MLITVVAMLALLVAAAVFEGAAEWWSRDTWRGCNGSTGRTPPDVMHEVETRLVLFRPSCAVVGGQLTCEWRTPLVRWACCATVEAGLTAGHCGSG
jgi:hypothetical protein